jgi:polyisoprenoid-binding protein YceI
VLWIEITFVSETTTTEPANPEYEMTATSMPSTAATSLWAVDATHVDVGFAVRHLMIATSRGRFGTVTGSATVDEQRPERSKVDITIDVNSIDTGYEQRDAHLRSPEFFDAEKFPTMRFASTKIEGDVTGDFTLIGDLTIRGVTRSITLNANAGGRGRDPWGNEKAGFSATGKLNRSDFGLVWNAALEAGGVAVSDEVKISIDLEFARSTSATAA